MNSLRDMSDLGGTTLPNRSDQLDGLNSTQCNQVDTLGHVFFMVSYSLVFVVSLKCSCYLRRQILS